MPVREGAAGRDGAFHAMNAFRTVRLGTPSNETAALARTPHCVGRIEQCYEVAGESLMDQGAMMWQHDLGLTADARSAARARSFVGQRLIEHELQYLADDVQLVVSELATNA